MPDNRNPTPKDVVQMLNSGLGDISMETLWIVENTPCPDLKDPTIECTRHHCPVCSQHYRMQIFSHPGPCRELCRKEDKGDHWPSRSTLVKDE